MAPGDDVRWGEGPVGMVGVAAWRAFSAASWRRGTRRSGCLERWRSPIHRGTTGGVRGEHEVRDVLARIEHWLAGGPQAVPATVIATEHAARGRDSVEACSVSYHRPECAASARPRPLLPLPGPGRSWAMG